MKTAETTDCLFDFTVQYTCTHLARQIGAEAYARVLREFIILLTSAERLLKNLMNRLTAINWYLTISLIETTFPASAPDEY